MLNIDSGIIAVTITFLLSIISLAAWSGSLGQKVKGNRKDIDKNEDASIRAFNALKKENNDSHEKLFDRVGDISIRLGEIKGVLDSIKKNGNR